MGVRPLNIVNGKNEVLYEIVMEQRYMSKPSVLKDVVLASKEVEWVGTAENKYVLLQFLKDEWHSVEKALASGCVVERIKVRVSIGNIGYSTYAPEEYCTVDKSTSKFGKVFSTLSGDKKDNVKLKKYPTVNEDTSNYFAVSYLIFFLDNIVGKVSWEDNICGMIKGRYIKFKDLTDTAKTKATMEEYLRLLESSKTVYSIEVKLSDNIPERLLEKCCQYALAYNLTYVLRLLAHEDVSLIPLELYARIITHAYSSYDFRFACATLRAQDIKEIIANNWLEKKVLDDVLLNIRNEVVQELVTEKVDVGNNERVISRFKYVEGLA